MQEDQHGVALVGRKRIIHYIWDKEFIYFYYIFVFVLRTCASL